SSRRRHTRFSRDWSSDVCSSDLLKQAAADFYKREYNVDIDPETEVAILFGTKIGLVELPLALMNEGELMLLPDPGYPDYLSGVRSEERRVGKECRCGWSR